MAKLYVFGIGGTGSRTLRALTMLLASGVECKFDTVVPVIIDPDTSAADMSRTVDAMRRSDTEYNAITNYAMLHVIYRLNIFGGKNGGPRGHEGGPGGRRGGGFGGPGGRPGGGGGFGRPRF